MSDEMTACHPYDEKCGGPGGPCRNHGGVLPDRVVLQALATAGWDEGEQECAAAALQCAADGDASHWPTAAGWLAAIAYALAYPATGDTP